MDKVTDPRDVFSTGMHSCLLSALASVLVGLVFIGSGMDTGYVWAVVGYTVANFFSITFLQFIRAVGHVRLYALSNILQTLLIAIVNVAFVVHFQWGEEGYMLGYTLSNALVTVIIFFAARLWRYYHPRLSDSRTVTRMLRYFQSEGMVKLTRGAIEIVDEEKLEALIAKINDLKEQVGIKKTIRDYGIDEKDFLDRLDDMVEQAFDDQCTGANPRYPLMSEIKQMYLNAYYGR